jgi:parvulin-like peptidyl-prolyl isomerase
MTKIRESLSTFFSVFAGLFVVYIVLDWGMDITGRRHSDRMSEAQEVGKINGKPVLQKEFAELVRRATDNQKAQSGADPDENQQKLIRDQVWEQLVDQALYDAEIKRLGITVTDQEIVNWVRGDDPPAFLKQQFTDSTGTFNRQAYDATIMDPKNKAIMVRVEDGLRKQREREKLQSIILAGVQVGEQEVLQRYLDQNIKYTADYCFFDPNTMVKDEEVKPTPDELRRYYNDHSDEFKMEASRKLKYVLFPEGPSHLDSTGVVSSMQDILTRVHQGADFLTLAKQESETPVVDSVFKKHGELSAEREKLLFGATAGDLLGPIAEADGYHLVKVLEFRTGTSEAIHASHILIDVVNNDSVSALAQARVVLAEARSGRPFGDVARQYSKDPSSASNNGDLGWFVKGRMVKPFEEAAFKAKVGQIIGPVRSTFGYHIILVHAKDSREVRFADLHLNVRMSGQTRSDLSQHAQDFSYLAKEASGAFEREAQQSHYTVVETPSFLKGVVIPGIGMNAAANKFAFSSKVGAVSEQITGQNGFLICMVSEVKEAGLRPFDEVKAGIESRVMREKKVEKTKEAVTQMRRSLAAGEKLAKLTTAYPSASAQTLPEFTLGGFISGVGRDLGFIGAVSALQPGETSKPVESTRGVYLIQLISKSAFDTTAYSAQRDNLRAQLVSEKKSRFFSQWADQLKKSAEIVDNRDNFYR